VPSHATRDLLAKVGSAIVAWLRRLAAMDPAWIGETTRQNESMCKPPTSSRRIARAFIGLMALVPTLCYAGTSAPFDVLGVLLLVAGFAVAVLVCVVGLIFARKPSTRGGFGLTLALVVGVPLVCFAILYVQDQAGLAKFERNVAKNREAYAAYCQQRDHKVFATAPLDETDSIAVRLFPGSPATNWKVRAFYVAQHFDGDRARCGQLNLRAIEEADEEFNVEKQQRETVHRHFALCEKPNMTRPPAINSRFEMIIGEQWQKDPTPWDGGGDTWLAKASVRIVDTRTTKTLGQDTLHFLRYESGEGVCPEAAAQLAGLMLEVFPRGRPAP
jgi:hypothetical protein